MIDEVNVFSLQPKYSPHPKLLSNLDKTFWLCKNLIFRLLFLWPILIPANSNFWYKKRETVYLFLYTSFLNIFYMFLIALTNHHLYIAQSLSDIINSMKLGRKLRLKNESLLWACRKLKSSIFLEIWTDGNHCLKTLIQFQSSFVY